MSWGESPSDFTGEPRKVFINFLIWNMKQIEVFKYLVRPRQSTIAISMLIALINSLDDDSKKKLDAEYKELHTLGLVDNDFERIYRKVTSHLHEKYLEEFRRKRLEAGDLEAIESEET